MNIEVGPDSITVDMKGYIDKCLDGREFGRKVSTPATADLFEVNEESPRLDDIGTKTFHSDVARVLYVGKKTRGEILPAVSFLASRVHHPTVQDEIKLSRVYNYLSCTRDKKLTYRRGGLRVTAHIDASYGCHPDGTSRTGVAILAAGAAAGTWSMKQRIVTKSATEAEVVGVSDGLTHVLWVRELMLAQGEQSAETIEVRGDNMGVISMMNGKRHPRQRTRHLNVRHFFARDRIESKHITLKHLDTKKLVADLLTKPLAGKQFRSLCDKLYG